MDLQKKLLDLLRHKLPAELPLLKPEQVLFDRPAPDRLLSKDIKPPAFLKKHAKTRHIMPEFCYVLKGEMGLKWGDAVYRLRRGDYCFIPRMIDHFESHSDPAVPYENLWVRFGSVLPLSVLHGCSDHYDYRIINRMLIECDTNNLRVLPELEKDHPLTLETAVAGLSALYAAIGTALHRGDYFFIKRFEKEKTWKRRLLVKVREYINGHLDEKMTLARLASSMSVSTRHLGELFKNEYGLTVVQYINGQRMDRALQLLEDTTLNISEISAELNFSDVYYFSRLFKKYFGISPKDFRNKYL